MERERRIEEQLKKKGGEEKTRDISEKMALGQAQPDKASNELLYD